MAPREAAKPKVEKITVMKTKSSPVNTIKKPIAARNGTEKSIGKVTKRTINVPKVTTPKTKENKPVVAASSVPKTPKSAKKGAWKRRPQPAHSGVPVPEKMRRLLAKQLQDCE